MKTKFIAATVSTLLWCSGLLCSCISEPLVPGGGGSTDGTLTPITLSIRGDHFRGGESFRNGESFRGDTRAGADESTIGCLHLLVFDSNGDAVLNEQFDNLTATNGTYQLQTETLPGNGMQFYAIANPDITGYLIGNLPNQLSAVTTLKKLNELLSTLKADTDGWQPTGRMLMTGHATINVIKPASADIPLTLGFLSSKVTVTLTDKTDDKLDIDITGWDMVNVPCKTYLLEQTGKDAVTGTKPEDYLTTTSKFPFESIDKEAKSWAQTCYLLENRRGGRVDRADPTNAADKYPGMSVSDTNQRGKAWYAPAGATYLLVYGTHTQNGQTNNILYKIYLGENAVNDYNLARGKHYQYNVSINGLNDIDIDTNVEWDASSFTVDQSDNLTMDAHPDVRVLRIGGTATDADTPAYATVEVLDQSGTSPGTWLAVSPLNLYRHAVKQTGSAADNQQFAAIDGVGSYVRTRYRPTPTAVEKFSDATFGMTRKLTKIPFAQMAVCSYQEVLLYADAYGGSGDRTGQVRITYYKGASGTEVAGQQTLTVVQSGALQVSANLYVERYEEAAMKLHPGLDEGLQRSSTMQWGYNTSTLYDATDRFCNGNFLTANAVYTNVAARHAMDAPQWSATDYAHYRAKYPATGVAVSEPSGITTSGTPYYYPELTQTTLPASYFHPIYNSSAARYCHEKNRDLNGDGVIDASETMWYLPSYADMVAIKKDVTAAQSLKGTYWTSSEEGADKCWVFTFPKGTAAMADKTTPYRVRCVRGAGTVIPDASIKSEETDETKINLMPDPGSNSVFAIIDDKDYGFSWTVTSNAPTWLQIATDAKGTAAAATQTGTGDATLYAYAVTENPNQDQSRTATLTLTRAMSVVEAIEVAQRYLITFEGKKSNCYMVPPGTAVTIPVERANESPLAIGGTTTQLETSTEWTASLVWESSRGLIQLSQNTGTGSLGRFKVTAANASTEGNAVVAIKNASNEILWSWHI